MKLKLPDQASKSQLKVRLQVPFLYKKNQQVKHYFQDIRVIIPYGLII